MLYSIAEPEQPQERFIQAVKWYLSAFHAGRKSSVAKKPYNPILGETFKCHWDVPGYRAPTTNNAVRRTIRRRSLIATLKTNLRLF